MKKVMKAVAALMLMTAVVCAAGCKKQEPSSGSFNGHEYVDLGLPSGTMWATSNVEAGSAKGYSYFAWGETETKSTYTWENYKWNVGDGIYGVKLTKYCYIPAYGYDHFTDNLTELEADDDPATVYWGEGWHTPTIEEWQELLDNCTYTWTKHNGVYGGLFTAVSNGNTLFLPGAGYMDRPEVGEAGGLLNEKYVGNYWAKSLSMGLSWLDETPNYVYSLYFNEGIATIDPFQRFHGMTIRPVHSAN